MPPTDPTPAPSWSRRSRRRSSHWPRSSGTPAPLPAAGLLLGILALVSWAGCGGGEAGEAGGGEGADETQVGGEAADSAQLLAARLREAMGGGEAWEETRYLQFRWIVERDGREVANRFHRWDRYDGRYRVAFERDGANHVAIFDLNEIRRDSAIGKVPAEGSAWVDGRPLEGTARDSALHGAYAAFVNDSYWLLMPWKWADPGVHLAYEGHRELTPPPSGEAATGGAATGDAGAGGSEPADEGAPAAESFEVVHLTFEPDLGMTNDQYWGFLDPETGLMRAWQYHLQGREEKGDVIWWRDWRQVGPIRLSARRVWPDGVSRIHFEDLAAGSEVPPDAFVPPGGGTPAGGSR